MPTRNPRSKTKKFKSAAPDSSESGLSDWFHAHSQSRKLNQLPRSQEATSFGNFLWPVSLDYFSPLRPIFLWENNDLPSLNTSPGWLVRDGLVPLLWFFKTFPKPGPFKSRLLVDSSFGDFVPKAWRPFVGTYKFESLPSPSALTSKIRGRKFLVLGVLMDTFASLKHISSKVTEVREEIGVTTLNSSEICGFLPGRFDGYGNEHLHNYHADAMIRICGGLGNHIKVWTWRQVESADSFEGFEVIELNEKLLCADNYLMHHVLSRGAKVIASKAPNPGKLVPLSPFHGMRVIEQLSTQYEKNQPSFMDGEHGLHRLSEVMRSDANQRFPWPVWFTEWGRNIIQEKPHN